MERSSGMGRHAKGAPDLSFPKGKAFRVGIGLMIASFGFLVFYIVLPFLPVSSATMWRILLGGLIANWGMFFVGTLLAGRDGYPYLKHLVRKLFHKR